MAPGLGLVIMAVAVVWLSYLMVNNDPFPPGDGPDAQNPSEVAFYCFAAFLVYIAGMLLLFLEALTY